MDRCPLELWAKITDLACTDGGFTGCSLSLVSRTMYNVVAPVRYHSVSLMGNRRLRAFAGRVVAMETPPIIQHILIGDIQVYRNSVFDLEDLNAWQQEQELFQHSIMALNSAIRTILISSAPHLRSLGIHGWNFDPTADLPAFPLLQNITLLGAPNNCAEDTHTRFPSLRRLHLLTDRTSHDFWLNLTRFAPYVTHLRLSNMSQDTYLAPFLRILLDIPPQPRAPGSPCIMGEDSSFTPASPEAQQAVILASRLSALEIVYAQPASYKTGGWCGTGSIMNGTMLWGLKSVAAAAARGEGVGRFVLLPEQALYILADATRDWLDVVDGGSGPWPGGPGAPGDFVSPSVRAKWPGEGNAYFSQPPDADMVFVPSEDFTGTAGVTNEERLGRLRRRIPTNVTVVPVSRSRSRSVTRPESPYQPHRPTHRAHSPGDPVDVGHPEPEVRHRRLSGSASPVGVQVSRRLRFRRSPSPTATSERDD